MDWQFDGYNYLARLSKGELLSESLSEFADKQKIKGGWISGVGGAAWAEVGFYNLDTRQYAWQKLDQLLEIVSLSGSLAWRNGQPSLHLHGAFAGHNMQTYGGHVKELEVGGTCEIFIHVWNTGPLSRSLSEETGLKLLDL